MACSRKWLSFAQNQVKISANFFVIRQIWSNDPNVDASGAVEWSQPTTLCLRQHLSRASHAHSCYRHPEHSHPGWARWYCKYARSCSCSSTPMHCAAALSGVKRCCVHFQSMLHFKTCCVHFQNILCFPADSWCARIRWGATWTASRWQKKHDTARPWVVDLGMA